MEPIDDNTSESVPETPQQKACPTTRRIIVREAFVSACAVAASILCVLFAIKLAPPVRAQGTPTPTPTCTATPTITPTPPCEPSVFGPCPTSPCPASPYPTGSPPLATPIPDEFQPQDENGERTAVVLQWRVYEPTSGGPKWPAAIILHEVTSPPAAHFRDYFCNPHSIFKRPATTRLWLIFHWPHAG